jgi:hypothetical protein
VLQLAVMRRGFEMTSQPVGGQPLVVGSVVQAMETKLNLKGVLRVRLEQVCIVLYCMIRPELI